MIDVEKERERYRQRHPNGRPDLRRIYTTPGNQLSTSPEIAVEGQPVLRTGNGKGEG